MMTLTPDSVWWGHKNGKTQPIKTKPAKPEHAIEYECPHIASNVDGHTECSACAKWLSPLTMSARSDAMFKALAPKTYELRTSQHYNKSGIYWEPRLWADEWSLPTTFGAAAQLIREWNARAEVDGTDLQFRLPLHCTVCYHTCHETFGPFGLCSGCRDKGKDFMLCSKCGTYTKKYHAAVGSKHLCLNCATVKNQSVVATAKAMGINPVVRKNGDYWKLSSANAPVNSQQWAYQGSGKSPYVITHYGTKRDGSTTTDGWACACKNFTSNVPRDHCKHIIKIMASIGVMPTTVSVGHKTTMKAMAGVNDEQLEAFKKWQLEQAEAKAKPSTSDIALSDGIMATGRKFR